MSHQGKYYRKKLKKDQLSTKPLSLFGFTPVSSGALDVTKPCSSADQPSTTACISFSLKDNPNEILTAEPITLPVIADQSKNSMQVEPECRPVESKAGPISVTTTTGSETVIDTENRISNHDMTTTTEAIDITESLTVTGQDSCHQSSTESETVFEQTRSQLSSPQYPSVSEPCGNSASLKRKFPGATVLAKYECQFPWLYFNASKNGYICKYCELFPKHRSSSNPAVFVEGTMLGDHPYRKLHKHNESEIHQESYTKYRIAANPERSIVSLSKEAQTKDVQTNRDYLKALIDTIFLVVTNRWALDKVSSIMEHCQLLEAKPITKFKTAIRAVDYQSSTSVSDILEAMNSFFEKQIINDINAADYVALLADESTDEANRTQFAVMIRLLTKNVMKDQFLGVVNVKKTDAASLMDAIENLLASCSIDIKKVMFVGFDGCNTMSGDLKGVQRRFRHIVPHSIYVNCRSHRLALCVKHLMNEFPVLLDVDQVLLAVYKLFDNSPQKFSIFKDIQAAYEKKELVLVRAAATRWLSHGTACKRFIDRFPEIIDSLDAIIDRKREPEIIGIRDMVTSKNTVAAIVVLCDMLTPVNYFCKYLQGSVDFSQVTIKLKELIDTLDGLVTQFRRALAEDNTEGELYLSKLPALFQEVDERTVFARRLRNQNVYNFEQVVEELACPMVYKLIGELQDGFTTSPVLSGFSVFNLNNLPESVAELEEYGKEQR